MTIRKVVLVSTVCVALSAAGAGAAFSFGKGKPKNVKCKAQVCGTVFNNGGIDTVGNMNVVTVQHPGAGQYCVELNVKLSAASIHQVLLSPTTDGGGKATSIQWAGACGLNGLLVDAWNRDGAGSVAQDQGFVLIVP